MPRAAAGRFVTVDEAYHWFDRAAIFLRAVERGRFAETNLIGHPGVTTMWLGAIGRLLTQTLADAHLLAVTPDAERALMRLPVAIVCALAVALAYAPLRRLFDAPIAALACLFWAAEPFVVAHSQLLHLDALLTAFLTLALLYAIVGFCQADRRAVVASGVCAGLGLLTKSPAIIIFPTVAAILAAAHIWDRRPYRALAAAALLWALVVCVTWFAIWPAAWVDLPGALGRVLLQAEADGGSPHGWGNYFWGRAVADPGVWFYPVVLGFRLAPWALLGACLALGAALAIAVRRRPLAPSARAALLLALFVILFGAMMTVPPKKFDRYLLPVFPAIDMLAALGWAALLRPIADRAAVRRALWGLAAATTAINLALFHPYELAYLSPLFGGAEAGVWALPLGWGEGYELAGDYLRGLPDGAERPIAVRYEPVAAPFLPNLAAPLNRWQEPGQVDYAIVYIDQIQRQEKPETFAPLFAQLVPRHIIRIHGIDYAYIFQIPLATATPSGAVFGDALRLRGFTVDAADARATGDINVTLSWEARARPAADLSLFIHVIAEDGTKIGQVDVPPGGPRAPTSQWQPGAFYATVQRVPLSAAPPGRYRVVIGVYDPTSGARLPFSGGAQPDAADGTDALLLQTIALP